ncbi:uncharacterized protein LOC126734348 isoform X2 [Anthonomus grandis grandis]|uniref:uncharacterized protein LOC126734348 isoform X2 n=1 Tax=Anthonomus grandis grandis TaxID=2921223 RepID=UPI0021658405|nr:uncharacterized protein LOC126734348 isoform X2 [Anthonomus grandis grandis]
MKRYMCIFTYFLSLNLLISCIKQDEFEKLSREKRTVLLLYGPFGVLQFILGFGTPIPDLLRPSTSLGFFMRGVYAVPKNASEYTHPNITDISRSSPMSRWDIYQALEKDSEIGHGGRPCVLRAICEAAEIPIDHNHGFFEEVFHTIFTPTSTNEKVRDHSDNEYLAAYQIGKKSKQKVCKQLFPECKVTFLDLFTHLFGYWDND